MIAQSRLYPGPRDCRQRICIASGGPRLWVWFSALPSPIPFDKSAKKLSRYLLQASVVGLGFGINLHDVVRAGRSGFVYTILGISFTMVVGMTLGAMLRMQRTPAFLISTGTAICGGSAIAAVGPITGASDEQMAISLGTVFVLNSVALLTFPAIGAALHLRRAQFGLWAALAIHDTSSVVGAAAKYGAVALAVGTTVKLARALWIVPMSLGRRADQACQGKNPVAMVHRPVRPGRRLQHLPARWSALPLELLSHSRENRPHRHPLSDRQWYFSRHSEESGTSSPCSSE